MTKNRTVPEMTPILFCGSEPVQVNSSTDLPPKILSISIIVERSDHAR